VSYLALPGTLSEREIERLLAACAETRYPIRNRVILLLAADAGLTPMEIAWLRRHSVQTDNGLVGDHIDLVGKKGNRLAARKIPLAPAGRLRKSLIDLLATVPGGPNDPLIVSERALEGEGSVGTVFAEMRPTSIGYVMWKLAERAKVKMAGARDARRTFIARVGRASRTSGGSPRDVQALAGHRSLVSTQRLLDADWEAQTRAIGTLFDRLDQD